MGDLFVVPFSRNTNVVVPTSPMSDFYIEYSVGPRFIDGVNIDIDANATTHIKAIETEISEPVTDLAGKGYEPGQKNRDGSEL